MIHDSDIHWPVSIQKVFSRLETFSSLIELFDLQPTKYYSLFQAAESRAMKYTASDNNERLEQLLHWCFVKHGVCIFLFNH